MRDAQIRAVLLPRFNTLLGLAVSDGIREFCSLNDISLTSIDLISTRSAAALAHPRTTSVDISTDDAFGWNAVITTETGISTIFDFEIREAATTRTQPPLTAFVEKILLRHPTKFRVCLNLGDLATLHYIPPVVDNSSRGILCRPCGPGSLFIDYAVRYCTSNVRSEDHDGKCASTGQVNEKVVERFFSAYNYFRTQPSLAIAREMFGSHEAQRLIDECLFLDLSEADTIATITRISAHNFLLQYFRLLNIFFPQGQKVDEIFICGPSAQNPNIINYLKANLPQSLTIKTLEDICIPNEAHEAIACAQLAVEAALDQAAQQAPASPQVRHPASFDTVRGRVVPGQGWERLLEDLQKFNGGIQLPVTHDVKFGLKSDTEDDF